MHGQDCKSGPDFAYFCSLRGGGGTRRFSRLPLRGGRPDCRPPSLAGLFSARRRQRPELLPCRGARLQPHYPVPSVAGAPGYLQKAPGPPRTSRYPQNRRRLSDTPSEPSRNAQDPQIPSEPIRIPRYAQKVVLGWCWVVGIGWWVSGGSVGCLVVGWVAAGRCWVGVDWWKLVASGAMNGKTQCSPG